MLTENSLKILSAVFLLSIFSFPAAADWDQDAVLNQASNNIKDVSFSRTGNYVAYGAGSNVYIHEYGSWNHEMTLTHSSDIAKRGLAFSSSGDWLAVETQDSIKIYNTADGSLVESLNNDDTGGVAFSPNGDYLGSTMGGYDYHFKIWETSGWTVYSSELDDNWAEAGAAFSENDEYYAMGKGYGDLEIYDVDSGNNIATLQEGNTDSGEWRTYDAEFTDNYVIFGNDAENCYIYEPGSWDELRTLSEPSGSTGDYVDISEDESWAGCADHDNSVVYVWDIQNGWNLETTFSGGPVFRFSDDGRYVAYADGSSLVIETNISRPNKPKNLKPPNETTTTSESVEISALYTHTGGKEGSLRFWNDETGYKGTRSWKYTDHENFIRNIAVGANGEYLFTGSYDQEVHQINVSDGSNSWIYNGHTNWVDDVATGPNAKYSYSGGRDDEVHQVNVSDGSNSWIYNGHSNNMKDLAAGPAGEAVYSASIGEGIHKINASSGKQIWTTQASTTFEGIHAGPDRNYIYGGGDGEVQQINVSDGSNGWIYDEHSEESNDVKVSPDGESVYIGAGYVGVHKVNSSNGDQVWTSPAQDFVRAVSVGPNGRNLYSADGDKVYQLNASDGSNGWNYSGHSNIVTDVAAGPNGDYVYSGSSDEEVHQINARDGSLIGTCNVQDGSRCGVNYDLNSGDNYWFVDAESDGNVSERSPLYNVIYEGNKAPDKVNNPENPKDGELIRDSSTVFNVSVSDPDGDDLEVKFRNNVSNQTSGGTASGVSSGDFATIEENLERGKTYKWWVNVSDQQNYTKSGSWTFYVNSLPSLDSFEPFDGSITKDDAMYLNATGSDKESSELHAYFYDDEGGFLGKDSGPETNKLVSDKWSNLDIGQVYKWEVRLSDGGENRTFGLFSFIRSTGSNYRLNMSFDIDYSSIISSPDSSEIFLLTVENKAGVPRSVTTYLEGVNSVFSESGKDSISYKLEPYAEKEMIVRVEPEEEGEKTLLVTTRDDNIRINTTEKIPVTVRNTPATLESKEVSGIGTVQLIMLVLSAVYLYSVRL